jgi:hypothetical protein
MFPPVSVPAVTRAPANATAYLVGDAPQGSVDGYKRACPILHRQVGEIDVHGEPRHIAKKKIDRRAALEGETGFRGHEREWSEPAT